jgi:transposase
MSGTSRRYSPEVRERAVRLVLEHQGEHESQWAAILSVAAKIGCTPETLRIWVRRVEVDEGHRPGVTSDERARLKELERENRELRRANEILKSASLPSTRHRNIDRLSSWRCGGGEDAQEVHGAGASRVVGALEAG